MRLTIFFLAIFTTVVVAYLGDITHYKTGVGSCGIKSTDEEAVVAISVPMMNNAPGSNSNNNPKCGSTITIWNPTTRMSWKATVVDQCQSCAYEDLDLSPSLFKAVAPDGDGDVSGIAWGGDLVGG